MVRKQVKALTVLYRVPCQHFGVYFAPYQILLVMGAVFVLLAIPFLLFYDRTVLPLCNRCLPRQEYASMPPTTARTTTAPPCWAGALAGASPLDKIHKLVDNGCRFPRLPYQVCAAVCIPHGWRAFFLLSIIRIPVLLAMCVFICFLDSIRQVVGNQCL